MARSERIQLSEEDAENAIAHTANLNRFEYMNRMGTQTKDEALGDALHGLHCSGDRLPALIANLKIDAEEAKGTPVPALDQLMCAALEARALALNEELNHAAQSNATGPLEKHLRDRAFGLVQELPLGLGLLNSFGRTRVMSFGRQTRPQPKSACG